MWPVGSGAMPARRHGPRLSVFIRRSDEALKDATKNVLTDYCGDRATYYKQVVASWDTKPAFQINVERDDSSLAAGVKPLGEGAMNFTRVSRGTGRKGGYRADDYIIRPKGDYRLKFQTGYSPKTSPGGRINQGGGTASGDTVYAQEVHHPGIDPRLFEEEMDRRQIPTLAGDIAEETLRLLRAR